MTATTKMKWGLTKGEEKIIKIACSSDSPQLFQAGVVRAKFYSSYESTFLICVILSVVLMKFTNAVHVGNVYDTLILSMHIRECTRVCMYVLRAKYDVRARMCIQF